MINRQRSVLIATMCVFACLWLSLSAIRAADTPPNGDAVTLYPYPCDPRDCRPDECGLRFDGCGGTIDCGTCGTCGLSGCESGETCSNCPSDCGPCPGGSPPPSPGPGPSPTPPPPGTNVVPTANPGGPYAGKVYEPIAFDGAASSDPQGDTTIVSYQWDFGDLRTGSGALVLHDYRAVNTYQVRLTVTDDVGHANQAATTATVTQVGGERYFATQAVQYAANLARLQATASLSIGPEDGALYTPRLKVLLTSAAGTVVDTTVDGDFTYRNDSPTAGTWTLRVGYYYVSKANPALEPTLVDTKTSTASVSGAPPPSAVTITGPEALWWFGGNAGDGSHPTSITLGAAPDSGSCTWTLVSGVGKASLAPSGCSASLSALAPSTSRGDVKVRVASGSATSPDYAVTVYTPWSQSGDTGGPDATRPSIFDVYVTRISRQVNDQFGRTIRGLTLTRVQWGPIQDYQSNDWSFWLSPPATDFIYVPSGWFALEVRGCDDCQPSALPDPYYFGASDPVFGFPERWYADPAGNSTRIQTDVLVWRRGYGEMTQVTR